MTRRNEGNHFLSAGAILAGLGVAAGAFGAHALKDRLTEPGLDIWRTAAQYQMYHALALVVVGRFQARSPATPLRIACWLFTTGIVLFSGSLYLLAFSGDESLGVLTPIGGVCLLAGWACLSFTVIQGPYS